MINRQNYHWVNEFLAYLLDVKQRSPETIDRYRFFLRHLLLWAMQIPLTKANTITPVFNRYVGNSKKPLALESQKKIIETARAFFRWAKMYHAREFFQLTPYWINDLTPPRINHDNLQVEYVQLEEAIQLATLPIDKTDLALFRDQAATAMLFISGARAGAFTTLPVQAVHLNDHYPHICQWPELGVHTKNNRRAKTYLHNIPELTAVVSQWDQLVRANCPPDYPWYAPIEQSWGEQKLTNQTPGKCRSQALSKRTRLVFQLAGLPYKSPHKFRHGYATYGLARCRTMAEFQALSRNLIHSNIAITDSRYAHYEEAERAKLLAGLSHNSLHQPDDDLTEYLAKISREGLVDLVTKAVRLLAQ